MAEAAIALALGWSLRGGPPAAAAPAAQHTVLMLDFSTAVTELQNASMQAWPGQESRTSKCCDVTTEREADACSMYGR
jgi:hypothetical protein